MASIGAQIRKARQRKRMTQDDLAKAVGVDRSAVSTWERGVHYPQRYEGAIEEVLDIDLSGSEPGLPPEIINYGHIPEVAAIWEIPDEKMPAATRLGLIRLWLSRHQEPPPAAQDRRTA